MRTVLQAPRLTEETLSGRFYAFDASPYAGSYEFIGNNFHQGMAYSSNVTITGCGNTVVSGVAFPTALRNAC
jgi:hypothetical protein